MPALSMKVDVETYRFAQPFRISGFVFEQAPVVVVTLHDGIHEGRGEASGVYYTGDDVDHMLAVLEEHRSRIEDGPGREELRTVMPIGGARNAVDCAMWELEAARSGNPPWQLAGQGEPRPLVTTFTLGAEDPAVMAESAKGFSRARSLKLKLTGDLDLDLDRVRAVRAARPDVWMGVDANQGFSIDQLDALLAGLLDAEVSLLEQPLRRGREADLEGFKSPIPIAADESVLGLADVAGLVGRFDVVNIKLDKCGGLTEGLKMAKEARRLGLGVMVGNMVGTSLSIAPAFVLGQVCDFVDLDGPIFLSSDRQPSVAYEDGKVWCGEDIWGARSRVTA
jgi:L-alanine-DL-glutamate epimerase-like enolase superfamily enzyme